MSARRGLTPQVGMIFVVFFWAGNFTAAKIAFGHDLSPPAFTAIRFVAASIVLFLLVRIRHENRPLPPGALWRLVVLGVLGNTIYQLCFVEGLARTSATKSSLILAGMPALVTIAAGMLGIERVTRGQRIAVLLATAGVAVVIMGRGGSMSGGFGLGDALLLAAVFMWATYTLLMRSWSLGMSSLQLTAWTLYTGTPGLVIAGIPSLLKTPWAHVPSAAWLALTYSAMLSLVGAYVLWNRGVATIGAARTVVYNTVVPLVATVIAMIGLHERPGLVHLVGGALILGGVLLTGMMAAAPEG